jgi:hypothetical protein
MTAIVLPDIDRPTLEELRKHIPSLAEIDIPSMENAGKKADQTIDRLLGRSRTPIWPWIAAGVFVVALAGTVAAYLGWNRRSSWNRQSDPWEQDTSLGGPTSGSTGLGSTGTTDLSGTTATTPTSGSGLSAAESSLMSGNGLEDQTA